MLRGHIESMVLSTLSAGEAHGFEVMQRLNEQGCDVFVMKEGTLYPVLYRLERDGLVDGFWESEDAPRKGPRRRIYRLTGKGKKVLADLREEWRIFVHVVGRIVEA